MPLNGEEVRACITPISNEANSKGVSGAADTTYAVGKQVTTIEGLPAVWAAEKSLSAADAAKTLHPIQQAAVTGFGRPSSLGESHAIVYRDDESGKSADDKNAISRAIHEASVKAGYADDDMFQRFLCLEPADPKVDRNYPGLLKPRTEKMLMIEVPGVVGH